MVARQLLRMMEWLLGYSGLQGSSGHIIYKRYLIFFVNKRSKLGLYNMTAALTKHVCVFPSDADAA